MGSTFTLAELTASEQAFRAPVLESPPVVPEPEVDPVEPVTEAPPAEGDVVDNPSDPTPEPSADEPAAPKGSARERIEDLVAERNALKKYIEYRDSLERAPVAAAPPAEAPVVQDDAPTLESCQFDTDKWTKAMNAWTNKQIQAGIKQALSTEKQAATAEDQKAKFEERMAAFEKVTPDLKVVLGNPSLPQLAKEAAALVVASELGPQILHHLGKNPEKAARISRQSPIQQAASIGRLEVELKVPPKPQKQISQAPVPPTPSRGSASPPEGGSIADFVARERKAMAERRRRH